MKDEWRMNVKQKDQVEGSAAVERKGLAGGGGGTMQGQEYKRHYTLKE